MAQYSKIQFSGSTNGRNIKVTTTADPGNTIHTVSSTSGVLDEIWLWATNTSSSTVLLTIEFGGNTNPDDYITVNVPAQTGMYEVIPGICLSGGVVVKAFAGTANVINISGFVNRIQ